MSIIWQVKEGSNRILGSLLFFLSVVVLIYASENLKNFNLDSFKLFNDEDITSIKSKGEFQNLRNELMKNGIYIWEHGRLEEIINQECGISVSKVKSIHIYEAVEKLKYDKVPLFVNELLTLSREKIRFLFESLLLVCYLLGE